MKEIQEKIILQILGAFVVAGGFFVGSAAHAAWVEPTLAPPGGNVAAPLNVSDIAQSKSGGLSIGSIGTGTPITLPSSYGEKTYIYGTAPNAETGKITAGVAGQGLGDGATTGTSAGVYAVGYGGVRGGLNIGLLGVTDGLSDNYFGVYGWARGGGSSYAGYFAGKVGIDGQLCLLAGTDCITKWDDVRGGGSGVAYFSLNEPQNVLYPSVATRNVAIGYSGGDPQLAPFFFNVNDASGPYFHSNAVVIGPQSGFVDGDHFCSSTETCASSDCAGLKAQCPTGRMCAPDGHDECVVSDTTPPSQPGAVSYGAVGPGSVELSWDASSGDTGGCDQIDGYHVYRCTGAGCTPGGTPVGSVNGSTTTYTDTTVATGTTYRYGVTAFDCALNDSVRSDGADVTTSTPDTTPPTVPGNLRLNATPTADDVPIIWDASTDSGSGLAGYIIYRCQRTAPSPCTTIFYFDTDNPEFPDPPGNFADDGGITSGLTFDYQISAYDGAHNESGRSNQLSVPVPGGGGSSPIMSKPPVQGGLREAPNKDIARITTEMATAAQAKHAPAPVFTGRKPLTALLSIPKAQAKIAFFTIPTAQAATGQSAPYRLFVNEGGIITQFQDGSWLDFGGLGKNISGYDDINIIPASGKSVFIGDTAANGNLHVLSNEIINGSLGIGAAAPADASFFVKKDQAASTNIKLENTDANGSTILLLNGPNPPGDYVQLAYTNAGHVAALQASGTGGLSIATNTGPIVLNIGGVDFLRLDRTTGNIGIKTPTGVVPTAPLDVRGNTSITGTLAVTGQVTSPSYCFGSGNCFSTLPGGSGTGTVTSLSEAQGIDLTPDAITEIGTIGLNLASANTWTAAALQTFNGGIALPNNGAWNTAGNLGIGGAPAAGSALSVGTTGQFKVTSVGDITARSATIDTNTLFVDATNHNVGIRTLTPAPGNQFEVNGNASATRMLAGSGTAANPSFAFNTDLTTGIFRSAAGVIGFSTNGTERIRMNASGQLVSLVSGATAPFTVASTTKVVNLNVDQLDGLDSTAFELTTGSTDFIRNQTTSQGIASFYIDTNGTIGTNLTVGQRINLPSLSLSNYIDQGGTLLDGVSHPSRYVFGSDGVGGTETRLGFAESTTPTAPIFSISDKREVHLGYAGPPAENATKLCLYGSGSADCRNAWPSGGGGGVTVNPAPPTLNKIAKFTSTTSPYAIGDSAIFDNGTNVGIGTPAPAGRLHVQGVDDATSNIALTAGADTAAPGVPDIRLGIGTALPSARLQVTSAGDTATSYTARFQSSGSVIGAGGILLDQNAANSYKLYTVSTGAVDGYLSVDYITQSTGAVLNGNILTLRSGKVGIGTTSPNATLTVAQPTTGTGTVATNGTITLTGTGTTFLNTFKVGDTITVQGETVRTIATIPSDTSLTVTAAFSTTASGRTYTLTGGTRFVALGNGNVGIGNVTPNPKFLVNAGASDNGSINDAHSIYANTSGSALYVEQRSAGGYAGYFSGLGFEQVRIQNTNTTQASGLRLYNNDTSHVLAFEVGNTAQVGNPNNAILYTTGATKLQLGIGARSSPVLTVDTTSRVGIGTTTPNKLLDVAGNGTNLVLDPESGIGYVGTFNNSDVSLIANNVDRLHVLAASGNVGVGTTNPSATFSVGTGATNNFTVAGASGDTAISGTLGVNGNTTLGDAVADSLTINAQTTNIPNGLNFIAGTNQVRVGTATDYLGLWHDGANARLSNVGTGDLSINFNNGKNLFVGTGGTTGNLTVGGGTTLAGLTATTATFNGNVGISGANTLTVGGDTTLNRSVTLGSGFSHAINVVGIFKVSSSASNPVAPLNGQIYYNSGSNKFQCYENGAWVNCIGAGGGEVPLTFNNGLTRSVNTITLGGALSQATTLTLGTNNLIIDNTSTGNFQIRNGAAQGLVLTSDATGNVSWTQPSTIPSQAPIYTSTLYGTAGDVPWRSTAVAVGPVLRTVYTPFSGGRPACTSGSLKFRLYVESTDNVAAGGTQRVLNVMIDGSPDDDTTQTFNISTTGGSTSPQFRTYLSGTFNSPIVSTEDPTSQVKAWMANRLAGEFFEIRKLELRAYCI